MRWYLVLYFVGTTLVVGPCLAQSASDVNDAKSRSAPTEASAANAAGRSAVPVGGRPENRWRYRHSDGRWWYWRADNRWSYFDGRRWVAARSSGYRQEKVDPALLRLEAKEGILGRKKWAPVPGAAAGGLPMSGTQGSAGGNPGGSFTDPGGTPSAVNTTTGSYFGFGSPPLAPPPRMQGSR